MQRVHNFSAGPCTLPQEVINQLAAELPEHKNMGMSLVEMSHRSPEYGEVHQGVIALLTELLEIPETHSVLLLQGGATLQFTMSAMNFNPTQDQPGNYVVAGTWGKKALADGQKVGPSKSAYNSEQTGFRTGPTADQLQLDSNPAFVHYTSNETIHGVSTPPLAGVNVPVVCDMSSDFLTKSIDWNLHDVVYAGAQKSLGPAGLCVAVVNRDALPDSPELPSYLSYQKQIESNSLGNTAPVFAIWAAGKMLQWIKDQGGIEAMESNCAKRSASVYAAIDSSDGFYVPHANSESRSKTNVTFTTRDDSLTSRFLEQAASAHLMNLKGHRSIGGLRASLYNGLSVASAEALVEFMEAFRKTNS